jgi:beta-lactamase class A
MAQITMNKLKVIPSLLILVIGIIIGLVVRETAYRVNKKNYTPLRIERHSGEMRHINPLLACDIAEEVLRTPEMSNFKGKIENFISNRKDKHSSTKVSVYFRELNNGLWFSIGDAEQFTPASLRKVPLMIALLKQSEIYPEKNLLNQSVKFELSRNYNSNQNIKPSQMLVPGQKYTVIDLIYRMIVYSDNNAFTALSKLVSIPELDNVYTNLRILSPDTTKDDNFQSVQTYESFFRVLYNASYLSKEASDWALDTLSKSEFKAGLVAGVPPSITVSHKFGEHSDVDSGTVQLHDCGIVYYPQNPYLLCVMSRGPNFESLIDVISEVSRIAFTEVDTQHKSNGATKQEISH